MNKLELVPTAIILGAIPVIAGFVAGWWISVPFVPESTIVFYAGAGLLIGFLVDLLFLRGWVRRASSSKLRSWMPVYLFYSVGMFGFFMGFPVFNVLLSIPAGVIVGSSLIRRGADAVVMKSTARHTAAFTTAIFGVLCSASATIALISPSTGSELQHMLALPFPVTPTMVISLIAGGGAILLSLQWWLIVKCVEQTYMFFSHHP
jgi:hypothetical protein